MKKSILARITSLMLAVVLCCTALPATQAKAVDQADPDTKSVAVEKEVGAATIDSLLDAQTLHPQKTGYAALDNMLESIIGPVRGKSVSEQIKVCYDWTIRNIDYSWAGYTRSNSGYNGFNLSKNPYPYNDYEEGLQKAFPEEVIARTYYTMKNQKGVCYDWAAVMAVMARYVGLDAYIHTGQYTFETALGYSGKSRGHHGWTEIVLSGKNYIFDPQREYRFTNDGRTAIDHSRARFFGIAAGDKYYSHYTQETSINAARDAGFLSVTAHRQKLVAVNAVGSRSGSVSGAGQYDIGTDATLTASPAEGKSFEGWFDYDGNLLSSNTTYTFTVSKATTVYAMFSGDLFYDLKAGSWYTDYAMRAGEEGMITGMAPHLFGGSTTMSRAMVVQILANIEKADLSQYTAATKFTDVGTGKWYSAAIAWAADQKIVAGVSDTTFAPNAQITRQEFFTMMNNYLEWKNVKLTAAELPYTDANTISAWAQDAVRNIQGAGLLKGYENGTIRPKNTLTRAEGATILVQAVDFLKTAELNPTEPETPAEPETPTEPETPAEPDAPTETPDTPAEDAA
ncbi:MAG: S-layer homology domain-containing protein [Eubacteriales bacterium]|nr:S-layer homology domain-containing protein [Eubacteriales bacterium]